jgi:hypothetical protein
MADDGTARQAKHDENDDDDNDDDDNDNDNDNDNDDAPYANGGIRRRPPPRRRRTHHGSCESLECSAYELQMAILVSGFEVWGTKKN